MKTNRQKIDLSFFSKFKQYNSYSFDYNTVEKSWNNGNGSLDLIRFFVEDKIILINESLFNNADERHLNTFIERNSLKDWSIKKVSYGYPDYYTKSFSLNLLKN